MAEALRQIDNKDTAADPLPIVRLTIEEAASVLRISRAYLYRRIRDGQIHTHQDGSRRYISLVEIQRYVSDAEQREAS
jgi:excisionase family DNA binding protein